MEEVPASGGVESLRVRIFDGTNGSLSSAYGMVWRVFVELDPEGKEN